MQLSHTELVVAETSVSLQTLLLGTIFIHQYVSPLAWLRLVEDIADGQETAHMHATVSACMQDAGVYLDLGYNNLDGTLPSAWETLQVSVHSSACLLSPMSRAACVWLSYALKPRKPDTGILRHCYMWAVSD